MNGAAVLIILLLACVVAPLRAHPARERRLRNLAVLRHAATSRPDALVGGSPCCSCPGSARSSMPSRWSR